MLTLGPIVGHTTFASSRIWLAAEDDPRYYHLELSSGSRFPFVPTEPEDPEFGTAIAEVTGLDADTRYTYVVRDPKGAAAGRGSFRTFPHPNDTGDICFASASCDSLSVGGDKKERGGWDLLADRVRAGEPRCLVMLGDQVYVDADHSAWNLPFDIDRRERRRRMAEIYHRFWSRAPVAEILANIPTYMIWDDHEIRNGWGSDPGDSPTLAQRFPAGRVISERYEAYFEDARKVYWHFQHVRNPPTPGVDRDAFLAKGRRSAMPFSFSCGATRLLILDNRGARDVWRQEMPVFGAAQWMWLRQKLSEDNAATDSLAVVVPLPVVSMPNHGIVQIMFGHRRDDIRLFARGDADALKKFPESGEPTSGASRLLVYLQGATDLAGALLFGMSSKGRLGLRNLTDVRDNWANHLVRRERNALLQVVLHAAASGRRKRAVTFIGGDLHVGALIDLIAHGGARVPTLITSGIGHAAAGGPAVGTVLGRSFHITTGLRARLIQHCPARNFGLTRTTRPDGHAVFSHELVKENMDQ